MTTERTVPALVGDEWLTSTSTQTDVTDPSTGMPVASVPCLESADVDSAVAAAVDASRVWRDRTVRERALLLRRTAEILDTRRRELVEDLRAEGGKPVLEAEAEADKAIATFGYYGGLAHALDGRAFPAEGERRRHETRLEAIGVVAAVTPWNVPAASPARKLAPALLAGNSVVVKPATATPISSYHLVRAIVDAGAPAGLVQLTPGSGRVVGHRLATHEAVDAVSFTGSTQVGFDLRAELARSLTRLQLELGGKNAAVVLPSADLDVAVEFIVRAAFGLAGQQCTATSRVIVHRSVANELEARLVRAVESVRVGPTDRRDTDMGPLIDAGQLAVVHGFVERAMAEGAEPAAGGAPHVMGGCYYQPTLLLGVTPGMEVAREEVFGPVLAVMRADDLDTAVQVLNDTPYGLSAAVHTALLDEAEHVVRAADCGVAVVNGSTAGIELAAPFGGFKRSGTESKEHGPESLAFYTRTKLVSWGW